MRTKIKKVGDKYVLKVESSGKVLGEFSSRQEAMEKAAEMRQEAKLTADTPVPSALVNLSTPSFVSLRVGGEGVDPIFAEEVERLNDEVLVDRDGNEIPRLFKEAFLLRPGTFNKVHKFKASDVEEYHTRYNPSAPRPIQIEHEDGLKHKKGFLYKTGLANQGTDSVRLHGILEFRGREAVENVEAGLWSNLSGGFYRKPIQTIKEVSVVEDPAVGGDGGERARMLSHKGSPTQDGPPMKGKESMWQKLLARLMKGRKKEVDLSKVATDEQVAALEDGTADLKCVKTASVALRVAQASGLDVGTVETILEAASEGDDVTAEEVKGENEVDAVDLSGLPPTVVTLLQRQNDKIETLAAKLEKSESEARAADDKAQIDALVLAGKVLPAGRNKTVAFLGGLNPKQKAAWLEMKGIEAPVVDLSRRSKADNSNPEGRPSKAEVETEVKSLLESIDSPLVASLKREKS